MGISARLVFVMKCISEMRKKSGKEHPGSSRAGAASPELQGDRRRRNPRIRASGGCPVPFLEPGRSLTAIPSDRQGAYIIHMIYTCFLLDKQDVFGRRLDRRTKMLPPNISPACLSHLSIRLMKNFVFGWLISLEIGYHVANNGWSI